VTLAEAHGEVASCETCLTIAQQDLLIPAMRRIQWRKESVSKTNSAAPSQSRGGGISRVHGVAST
jgi:hypothetical protein